MNIKPTELTFPKFSTHESEAVRSFSQMIDKLNRYFYPHLDTFNAWSNHGNYKGSNDFLEDLKNQIDYHRWKINKPDISEEVRNDSKRDSEHYRIVLIFKYSGLVPELNYLNGLKETGEILTTEQNSRCNYLDWVLRSYRY